MHVGCKANLVQHRDGCGLAEAKEAKVMVPALQVQVACAGKSTVKPAAAAFA